MNFKQFLAWSINSFLGNILHSWLALGIKVISSFPSPEYPVIYSHSFDSSLRKTFLSVFVAQLHLHIHTDLMAHIPPTRKILRQMSFKFHLFVLSPVFLFLAEPCRHINKDVTRIRIDKKPKNLLRSWLLYVCVCLAVLFRIFFAAPTSTHYHPLPPTLLMLIKCRKTPFHCHWCHSRAACKKKIEKMEKRSKMSHAWKRWLYGGASGGSRGQGVVWGLGVDQVATDIRVSRSLTARVADTLELFSIKCRWKTRETHTRTHTRTSTITSRHTHPPEQVHTHTCPLIEDMACEFVRMCIN